MPNANRFRGITTRGITTESRSMRYSTPIWLESVVDLRSEPNNIIIRGVDYGEIEPPQDRDEFMSWYFARRPLESISSRDVQNAEDVWRFVSGEPDDLAERAEREQLWRRTSNVLDRRKGNAVVAFTIRC